MEMTLKSLTLLSGVFLTGLSAGFFYAWQVSVIPGTRKVVDQAYLETMQSINRAILNPAFYIVFFGCLILLVLMTWQQARGGMVFWWSLGATLTYLLGTFGVTALGNVPLNDSLDVLNLADLTQGKAAAFRSAYERPWNRLHLIRTFFSVLSFLLSLLALFSYSNQ